MHLTANPDNRGLNKKGAVLLSIKIRTDGQSRADMAA